MSGGSRSRTGAQAGQRPGTGIFTGSERAIRRRPRQPAYRPVSDEVVARLAA